MCGRSRCSLSPQQVVAAARVPNDRWKDKENYRPSYNVAPGYNTPVVKRDKQQELEVHTMKWGLVPSFTKTACSEKPDHFRMFNARSETVAEKSVFSRLLQRQRCVVLFDGFYEWKKEGARKQPFYVNTGEGTVMRMAGLFDVWSGGADDAPLYTYTILTTDSSKRLQWLHDRMPVILTSDDHVEAWLDTKPLTDKVFNGICIPYNGEDLVWHPVTPSMSSMGYQSPDASQNVELKRGNIGSFFKAKTSSKAGTATTKSPASAINSAERRSTASEENAAGNHTEVKAKVEASQQARLSTSGAHQSSADAVIETAGNGRQPGSSGTASIQASQDTALANAQNDAKVNLDSSIVDPVNDEDSKVEVTTDDVLNTDDAGGIVAKPEPESGAPADCQHNSPPSVKRHARQAHSPQALTPASKRAKTEKPAKGTIESFFGPKK